MPLNKDSQKPLPHYPRFNLLQGYTLMQFFSRLGLSALTITTFLFIGIGQAAPVSFDRAKVELKEQVYFDQNRTNNEFYCGCNWNWVGRSGGRVDFASCGYEVRKNENRAARIEWEHIMPAHSFGHARQCWQNGGRKNCISDDPVFRVMEADMHNLTPAVGEVNGDRSNFRFGMLPNDPYQHGRCDVKVNFKQRAVQPRDEIKGRIARLYFYMHDRYDLRMSDQQQKLMMAWHKQFPISQWERERDNRIAKIMGHANPFVTGDKTWQLNHKNSRSGLVNKVHFEQVAPAISTESNQPIRGNRNSQIYHRSDCPSYEVMSEKNIVTFETEAQAIEAGYRKAKNCN